MLRVVRTRKARRDMAGAIPYLEKYSEKAARRLEAAIQAQVDRIAEYPESGQACDELRPGIRRVVVGDYLLFYRVIGQAVQVLRFLHGARDLPQFFEPDA
jgi:toxin ParE1/3/4